MTDKKELAAQPVAGSIVINAQLASSGKSMTFSTYVYPTDDTAEINGRIDQAMEIIDRQRLKAEIPELEARLEMKRNNLKQIVTTLETLKERQNTGKLSGKDLDILRNLSTTFERENADIKEGIEKIAEAKAKVD